MLLMDTFNLDEIMEEQEEAELMFQMGCEYEDTVDEDGIEDETKQDIEKAIECYEFAATKGFSILRGNGNACFKLGMIYKYNKYPKEKIRRHLITARSWLERAEELGYYDYSLNQELKEIEKEIEKVFR